MVLHKVFDCFPSLRAFLNLVKDYDGLTFIELDSINELEPREEIIPFGNDVYRLPECGRSICEINEYVTSVFPLCEFLH